MYFNQALEVLRRLPESHRMIEKAIDIRVDLGPSLVATLGFLAPEVEENYTLARKLCEQLGETPQLFPVLWGLARMHDIRGELRVGQRLGEQLLDLAHRAQEPQLLLEAHHEIWANLIMLGELTSARIHLEQGFALYDSRKHRHHAFLYGGHDPGVCCAYHSAEVLWLLGYPDRALRRSQDSISLARELSHPSTLVFALFFAAWFHQERGEMPAVQARVEEGMTVAAEQRFSRWIAQGVFLRGSILVERGHQEAGMAEMSKVLGTELNEAAPGRWNARGAALLAEAYKKTGHTVEGLNTVTEALSSAHQTECSYYAAELHRLKGELLLTQAAADEQQAEACFQNALKVAQGQSARSLELRAAMSLSRLWQRQGKRDEARQLLGEIYGWFTEGFDTTDLKQAKALLEELT
jgi:predicted ATPase